MIARDDAVKLVKDARLQLLVLEHGSNDHCQGSGPQVENVVHVLGPQIPLQFCSLLDCAFELLEALVVKLVELLHIATI